MAHETRPGDGREKSDAALLAEFAQLLAEAETGIDNTAAGMALMEVIGDRGREYLSGTRPLPTDEVAELSARVSVLAALTELLSDLVMAVNPWAPDNGGVFPDVNGRNWFDYRNDLARACIEHGHTANVKQERGDTTQEAVQVEFKRLWDGRKEEADSLSARVAELEALGRVSSAIIFDVFNRGLSADCVENQAVAQNLIEAWGEQAFWGIIICRLNFLDCLPGLH